MKIENGHRLSVHRFNAPFRGTSSAQDFTNQIGAVAHDMTYLSRVSGLIGEAGHAQQQESSFDGLYLGEGEIASTMNKVGTYCSVKKKDVLTKDLMATTWISYGGVVKSVNGAGVSLKGNGTSNPAGVKASLAVQAGQIVYLRMKVRSVSTKSHIAIGSARINNGGKDLRSETIFAADGSFYIDKRLYCPSSETIDVTVDVTRDPDVLVAEEIVVEDFHVHLLSETPVGVPGIDNVLKPRLERAEDIARFIREQ